ncbi:MAG: crossover junction endodeoxyribonuclease RuvC, crossover junction endodeoxyribonuclease RuvC [Candidatus Parcubacteria bacterium]
MTNKTTIAIDPGYDRIGIAVFEGKALVHSECFETDKKAEFTDRLLAVHKHVTAALKKCKPESLALETLFFSTNVKTAIKVSEARGVILLAAAQAGVAVHEYSPQAVKIAVTGSGTAPKEAVIRMVARLVQRGTKKRLDDEYDAIALGLAHTATIRPS